MKIRNKLTIYKDNITERNTVFEKLVLLEQKEMKSFVTKKLRKIGKQNVTTGDGYVFYKGTFPVLLCAHMDTVHKEIPSTMVYANGTLSSTEGIGGDDRCGIYMIFKILKHYDCSVVFLEDEEIGCVGAKKFAKTDVCKSLKGNLKYIIEFDRKDKNHAVTYDCDNPDFDKFITKEFFKKEYGTCSDISYIAPAIGVAAVNFSCGYYKEHHLEEWVNLKEMETIIVEAMKVLERTKALDKPFKYIESKNKYGYYGGYYGYGYGGYRNSYSGYNYDSAYDDCWSQEEVYNCKFRLDGDTVTTQIIANDEEQAYYKLFKKYQFLCWADIIEVTEM